MTGDRILEPTIYKDMEQRSEEWFDIHNGVISGTSMKSALGGPKAQKTLAYKKIAEKHVDESILPAGYEFEDVHLQEKILEGRQLNAGDILQRGCELEHYVEKLYTKKTGNEVEEVGFVKIDEYQGCSPDGLISKAGFYIGVLEMKCPMGPNFIKYLCEGGIPEEYKGQAMNYFMCMPSVLFVDFVIYHPGASDDLGQLHIRRINRDDFSYIIDAAKSKVELYKKSMIETEKKLFDKYSTNEKITGK